MMQLWVILAYFVALLGIGIWSTRSVGSPEGFFVAHRQGSVALIVGSLLATVIGGSATVGISGLGFNLGLVGGWWLLAGSIGLVVLGLLFAKKVRGSALYTLPELAERQYDSRVGLGAAVLIVVAWTGVVAGQIVAAGKVLSILGLGSQAFWMVVFTGICVVYAVLGGQVSIIRTDLVQAGILAAGILCAVAVLLVQVGGMQGLRMSLPESYFAFPVSSSFDWRSVFTFLILIGATYVVGPDIYSRLFCARNEVTARRSALVSAGLILPMALAIVLIGMGGRVLYPQIAAEEAFPAVISGLLSPFLSGLVLAALVAALMSSADTCLLSQSVILTQDIVRRFRPSMCDRTTLAVSRVSLLALGLLGLGLALVLNGVISSLLFAYTIFTCGLVEPVVAGFYRERLRVTSRGALAALLVGGIVGLLGKIPGLDLPLKGDLGLIGFGASAVVLFGFSFLERAWNRGTSGGARV